MAERSITSEEIAAVLDGPSRLRASFRGRRVFIAPVGGRTLEVVLSPPNEEPPTVITV